MRGEGSCVRERKDREEGQDKNSSLNSKAGKYSETIKDRIE